MRFAWVAVSLSLACGGGPAPAPAAAVAEAPRLELLAARSIDCAAASPLSCVVVLPLTVVAPRALALRSIHATRDGLPGSVTWSYDAKPLPAGRTRLLPPTGLGAGRWSIEIVAADASGAELRATTTATVHDRRREAALAACDACHGTWGSYGITGTPGCDCQTTDAGKVCHDASDCQGDCLEPTVEPIDATSYRFIGRCSPRTKNFGCLSRVRPGTHPRAGAVHVAPICVD